MGDKEAAFIPEAMQKKLLTPRPRWGISLPGLRFFDN
jgi:hypothetical protein